MNQKPILSQSQTTEETRVGDVFWGRKDKWLQPFDCRSRNAKVRNGGEWIAIWPTSSKGTQSVNLHSKNIRYSLSRNIGDKRIAHTKTTSRGAAHNAAAVMSPKWHRAPVSIEANDAAECVGLHILIVPGVRRAIVIFQAQRLAGVNGWDIIDKLELDQSMVFE